MPVCVIEVAEHSGAVGRSIQAASARQPEIAIAPHNLTLRLQSAAKLPPRVKSLPDHQEILLPAQLHDR
jgi:hypothetical protein